MRFQRMKDPWRKINFHCHGRLGQPENTSLINAYFINSESHGIQSSPGFRRSLGNIWHKYEIL